MFGNTAGQTTWWPCMHSERARNAARLGSDLRCDTACRVWRAIRTQTSLLLAAQSWSVGSVGSQTLQRRGLEALSYFRQCTRTQLYPHFTETSRWPARRLEKCKSLFL